MAIPDESKAAVKIVVNAVADVVEGLGGTAGVIAAGVIRKHGATIALLVAEAIGAKVEIAIKVDPDVPITGAIDFTADPTETDAKP